MEKRDLKADLELCNQMPDRRIYIKKNQKWPSAGVKVFACKDACWENFGQVATFANEHNAHFFVQAREGWPHAIERAMEAEDKLEMAKTIIQSWFDGEISAFGVMDSMIIDLEFDIDGIPDEVLEYHGIKRKEVLSDGQA